jgi:hypothetical protein
METTYLIADEYEVTIKMDTLSLVLIAVVALVLLAFWKFAPKLY